MKLSFKFKIALISFAVSSILLFSFGIAFFAFVFSSGIERTDRELRVLAESSLRGGHPDQYWKDFGNSLKYFLGEDGEERLSMIVLDAPERIILGT